ncbi:MAG TPA: SulP family inorganic anion transporter, partial [Gemmataceae bacterium]|nr:SulP family inorganic anion transporter [Gemmataceae bacterium]
PNPPAGARMPETNEPVSSTVPRDLAAGLVVFLVALPLCLGIALASAASTDLVPPELNVPLFAGLIAGIVGGLLVGALSGSHSSVSGPAAGLTAVVAAQIVLLGSYQAFLLAVVVAGVIQIVLGVCRAGFLSAFFPSSVIKGLLAAIGVILILKQTPHVFGHDKDPEGDMAFLQPDQETTFSELARLVDDYHVGAAVIGVLSVLFLVGWDKVKALKKSPVPAPLLVVIIGVLLALAFRGLGDRWLIEGEHLVKVPVAKSAQEFFTFFMFPDFSQWLNPKVYLAGFTIAAVASLETLINLQGVDKIDPRQRTSPPSRELWAQGVGNLTSGLIGGLPITSVIVRSSVNINAGARTKLSAIWHGVLLVGCVAFLPHVLNLIPLSCLAAILVVTGFKLASPALFKQMWSEGRYQFAPFVITVAAIVLTDLLVGVLIGLGVSLSFILWSNLRRPIRMIIEKHLGGEVVKIDLANQVSFLNKAALSRILDGIPAGGHVLLDASRTDYIDPDILDLIRDFDRVTGPARGIEVSLTGFRTKYRLEDRIQYVDYSTRDLQSAVTPAQVLDILKSGNERFRTGQQLTRDYGRQVAATADGEHPLAVVLSCVDSRTPAELIFDVGVGDIYVVRIAGTVTSRKVLGSVEYGCAVAGAKLVVVLGHTRCGAVDAAVEAVCTDGASAAAGNLGQIVADLRQSIDADECAKLAGKSKDERAGYVDGVSRKNVARVVGTILGESPVLAGLVRDGRVAVVGAMYDVATGGLEFLPETAAGAA